MNKIQNLLGIMAEECNELAVELSKAKRFDLHDINPLTKESNIDAITREFNDLLGMVEMINREINKNGISIAVVESMQIAKIAKVHKWNKYSIEKGCLFLSDKAQS